MYITIKAEPGQTIHDTCTMALAIQAALGNRHSCTVVHNGTKMPVGSTVKKMVEFWEWKRRVNGELDEWVKTLGIARSEAIL